MINNYTLVIESRWTDTFMIWYIHHIRLSNGFIYTGVGKTYNQAVRKAMTKANGKREE